MNTYLKTEWAKNLPTALIWLCSLIIGDEPFIELLTFYIFNYILLTVVFFNLFTFGNRISLNDKALTLKMQVEYW